MAEANTPGTEALAPASEKRKTVMIAMDGSKHSIHAFEWYLENVYNSTDNVIIAHCAELIKLPTMAYTGSPATIQMLQKEHEDQVRKVIQTIDDLANKHNIKHTVERLYGHSAGHEIVEAAKTKNVDVIIAGSRGIGGFRRTIMGSVSDYILHHAHVPVVICKHQDEHHKLK